MDGSGRTGSESLAREGQKLKSDPQGLLEKIKDFSLY